MTTRGFVAAICMLLLVAPAGAAPIEGGPKALASFRDAVARTRAARTTTRIVQLGDSHTAADQFTGALRRALARELGDAGPGFLYPVAPWTWYRRSGVSFESSTGWVVDGLGAGDGRYGISGLAAHADAAGERVCADVEASRYEVWLLRQPGGGAVAVALDGEVRERVSLAGERVEVVVARVDAARGRRHVVEVSTTADGRSRILGIVAERDGGGVVYDALGINGAEADRPLSWDRDVFSASLGRRDPDLVVVAFGTNDASNPDFEVRNYEACFAELLGALKRAAPRASLLVLGPPDRCVASRGVWRPLAPLDAVVAAQRRAALAAGAAFWDQRAAMGGPGSIATWAESVPPLAQRDRAHLTRDGYERVAGLLYAELMHR